MKVNIFEYLDYRKFIGDIIESRPSKGYGERKKLAEALNCQMAFITHVLNSEKDFNHEQILKVATYFALSESEREYLIDLLSFNRAGTKELKDIYRQRMREKQDGQLDLKNRFKETSSLNLEDQAKYYSHWLYGAVHVASSIPGLQSVPALANYFNIDESELLPILEFLASKGIVLLEGGQVRVGNTRLYVAKDSPLANQHHSIWRLKALHDLNSTDPQDFHYSLCFSVAKKDWPIIREKLVSAIDDCLKTIRPSKDEKMGLICVDFQKV